MNGIEGIWSDSSQGVGAVNAYLEAGKRVPPITGADINSFLKQWKQNCTHAALHLPSLAPLAEQCFITIWRWQLRSQNATASAKELFRVRS